MPKRKRTGKALLALLSYLLLFGTGWWLKAQGLSTVANALILGSGLAVLISTVALLRRVSINSRPTPMD